MTWHALPGPAQVALAWAVNIGGHAWTSELAALADLEAAGLVHRDADDSSWTATDKGRAIYHERNEIPTTQGGTR